MSRKKLKLNTYEKKKTIVVPPGKLFHFVLKRKPLCDVTLVPKSMQLRAFGTSDEAVKRKGHSLAEHGLMEPLYSYNGLNGNDEVIDGYTRYAAIDGHFEAKDQEIPFYELLGTHGVEDVVDLQLYLNQDKTEIQGNDKATIRKVLLRRLVNQNSKTGEEKLQECYRVVNNAAPTSWSTQAKSNLAKEIFNEINGGNTSILADIEGYTTGLVKRELIGGIQGGLFQEISSLEKFIETSKDGTLSFRSGSKFIDGKTVRVLPVKDVTNNVGKEGGNRYIARKKTMRQGDEVHWIMFVSDNQGVDDILKKRSIAEEKATKLMGRMMPDVNFYVWFFPQISESVAGVKAETSGTLLRGKSNTYNFGSKVLPINKASGGSK